MATTRIKADYTETCHNASVRNRFVEKCELLGYKVRSSIRDGNKRGLQAWDGERLVGEYDYNAAEAWVDAD